MDEEGEDTDALPALAPIPQARMACNKGRNCDHALSSEILHFKLYICTHIYMYMYVCPYMYVVINTCILLSLHTCVHERETHEYTPDSMYLM